jgi:hypothetical protein
VASFTALSWCLPEETKKMVKALIGFNSDIAEIRTEKFINRGLMQECTNLGLYCGSHITDNSSW